MEIIRQYRVTVSMKKPKPENGGKCTFLCTPSTPILVFLQMTDAFLFSEFENLILDSQMVPQSATSQWVKFDILPAVKIWTNSSDKNYGLVVEVEDAERNVIPASSVFQTMDCNNGELYLCTTLVVVHSTKTGGRQMSSNKTFYLLIFYYSLLFFPAEVKVVQKVL